MKPKGEAYDDKNTKPKEMTGEIHQLYKCIVCDYSCSKKCVLKNHVQSVHEGKKPHECCICSYSC